jgi:hypothetical protein
MARGMELTALIVVVLFLHQTCNTIAAQDHCPPSSCGSILNISHPFRLTSNPENCGKQRYNLSCENNQTLVLHLYHGRYYIQQINYTDNRIRVVDPGIGLNANEYYSFIPRYSLEHNNFSSRDPYQSRNSMTVYFVKCEKQVNSRYHLNISACFEGGVYSSKRYTYALFQYNSARDYRSAELELGDLCQVEQISLISWRGRYYYDDDLRNISCTDFHNELLRGFELYWGTTLFGAYIKELMHAKKKIHITLAISN